MTPLIGITCSRVVGGAWELYSLGHFMNYTFDKYFYQNQIGLALQKNIS